MKNKKFLIFFISLFMILQVLTTIPSFCDLYKDRFLELYNCIKTNGCLSPEGIPYHSREKRIVEATDYGHCSTSEGISFLIWLEAMYDYITNNSNWSNFSRAWDICERYYIPPSSEQPNFAYNSSKPASVVDEHDSPTAYPSSVDTNAPVGNDPIWSSVTSATGRQIPYLLHWYLDVDDWLGFGQAFNIGISGKDGRRIVKTNTFQRGPNESTWETIHHPSFDKKPDYNTFYVPLFVQSDSAQWRYTSAPDAEARIAQAMWWAELWAAQKGVNINNYITKTRNLGHWMRYCLFDKYFRRIGQAGSAGSGYNSCHYLISWYIAWGGPVQQSERWGFLIGCHSAHTGYQNPLGAYYWAQKGVPDWEKSLRTQLALAKWLQVPKGNLGEGAFGGGVCNDYPDDDVEYTASDAPTFNPPTYTDGQMPLRYTHHPVYWDPGSNTWCGWQYWFSERLAQFYFILPSTSPYLSDTYSILKNWMDLWAVPNFKVKINGQWYTADTLTTSQLRNTDLIEDVNIPISFVNWDWLNPQNNNPLDAPGPRQSSTRWQGWNGKGPGDPNYGAKVEAWGHDVGLMGAFVKCLIFYKQGLQKHNHQSRFEPDFYKYLAKTILDVMWKNFKTDLGISAPEIRTDYVRFTDTTISTVYVPQSKRFPNIGLVNQGNRAFKDTRPDYGEPIPQDYKFTYHRTWQQAAFALALGYYSLYENRDNPPSITLISPSTSTILTGSVEVRANITDDIELRKVELYVNNNLKYETILTTNTYLLNWIWNTSELLDSTHTLKIVAVDSSSQTFTYQAVFRTDNNTPPTVSIVNPLNNSNVSGVVNIEIQAQDQAPGYVERVVLSITNPSQSYTLQYTFLQPPYTYSWDTTSLSTGSYIIRAIAYDNMQEFSQAQINIRIFRIEGDNPPQITIISPQNNATYYLTDTINLHYQATDDNLLSVLEIFIDNILFSSTTLNLSSYQTTTSIYANNLSTGTHWLVAEE
ncbi:MAG: glycoside hydrolase family 48 protein [Endomicrobiia bacterium]